MLVDSPIFKVLTSIYTVDLLVNLVRYLEDIYSCQRQSKWDRQCVLEGWDIFLKVSYLVNITAVNALGSASHVLPVIFEDISKIRLSLNLVLISQHPAFLISGLFLKKIFSEKVYNDKKK